ncbi:hypothetical protein L3Q65_01045 (plasmid) [Amycolatopsis sp. FU40]|uniref:hypothetical protein n=1 Tax=Amycolatopsis sp. FU40 TaxID=2914159 RepID=UPI001F1DE44F|nr:hypothetical protein [Amycolatopsis sp. FU40]UKD50912.1 hypothetical protein L3Q65_01045 [Amycolatopsis sp. FU40]
MQTSRAAGGGPETLTAARVSLLRDGTAVADLRRRDLGSAPDEAAATRPYEEW